MSIKLARICEAHHCVSWLAVGSELQCLGPAPAEIMNISGPAAHSASSLRTPGFCSAKLIPGCLSVADGACSPPCFAEEQQALHCPQSPSCGHSPLPQGWLPDSLTSSARGSGSALPIPAGKCEVSCHLQKRFVIHCLCRHHPSPERHPNTCTAPRVLPEVSSYLEFYSHAQQKISPFDLVQPCSCKLQSPHSSASVFHPCSLLFSASRAVSVH